MSVNWLIAGLIGLALPVPVADPVSGPSTRPESAIVLSLMDQILDELEQPDRAVEVRVDAIVRLAEFEQKTGRYREAERLWQRWAAMADATELASRPYRVRIARVLVLADEGKLDEACESIAGIGEVDRQIEAGEQSAIIRIRRHDVIGAGRFLDLLDSYGERGRVARRQISPRVRLETALVNLEQGDRESARQSFRLALGDMRHNPVILWGNHRGLTTRQLLWPMLQHGFVEDVMDWVRLQNVPGAAPLAYDMGNLALDLAEAGYLARAWQVAVAVEEPFKCGYCMASIAALTAQQGERMDADERLHQTLQFIERTGISPTDNLRDLLIRTAWEIGEQDLAREMLGQQVDLAMSGAYQPSWEDLVELVLLTGDTETAGKLTREKTGGWDRTELLCLIARHEFRQGNPGQARRLMREASDLTVHAGTGCAVAGDGLPVMRSDNWIRAVVAGYWLPMGEYAEAASLLRQVADSSRHQAAWGISRAARCLRDPANRQQWLNELDARERLHVLIGVYQQLNESSIR